MVLEKVPDDFLNHQELFLKEAENTSTKKVFYFTLS